MNYLSNGIKSIRLFNPVSFLPLLIAAALTLAACGGGGGGGSNGVGAPMEVSSRVLAKDTNQDPFLSLKYDSEILEIEFLTIPQGANQVFVDAPRGIETVQKESGKFIYRMQIFAWELPWLFQFRYGLELGQWVDGSGSIFYNQESGCFSLYLYGNEVFAYDEIIWPVTTGYITAYFHDPTYIFAFEHTGIDIAIPKGTSVRAASSGYVSWVYLNTIMLSHGGKTQSLYGHMSRIDVRGGELVHTGQVIGLSGGAVEDAVKGEYTTGPHLHFSILIDTVYVNPLDYLP